jgi:hypothetical protein
MIHEFTPVLGREPTGAELGLGHGGLDPICTEGPHPALAHLSVDATILPAAIITAVRAVERLAARHQKRNSPRRSKTPAPA